MANHRILPITKPPVHGYLHHAHQLAIVAVDPKNDPWFYSNYIQLYSFQGDDGLLVDFFSYDGRYPRFPGLNGNWITKPLFMKTHGDMIRFVTDSIDHNYYVELLVDEYYISNKAKCSTESFIHPNLVYGYDNDKSVFHVIGFDKLGIFTNIEINYEEMREAFEQSSISGIGMFGQTDPVYSNTSLEVNIELIKTYLNDFIEAENSFTHYKPADAKFGIEIYDLYNEEFLLKSVGDVRPLHIFWEHKKVMLDRFTFLAKQGYLRNADQMIEEYTDIAKYFANERLLLVKAYMDNDITIAEKLGRDINIIAAMEREILKQVVQNL